MRFLRLQNMVPLALGGVLAACATNTTTALPAGSTVEAASGRSRLASDAKNALLYVSDPGAGTVTFYSYPELEPQGTLTGLQYALGLCVDPSTQDVWAVDGGARELFEFAHGATTPLRDLTITAYYPSLTSCAVNPKNGDLAVVSENFGSDPGAVMIFKNASGQPTYYTDSKMFFYNFVTYDANGNAFVDGFGYQKRYGYSFELAELTYGGTKLQSVTPKALRRLRNRGSVQYDGSELAIGNEKRGFIYEVSGREVTGTTRLANACRVWQFFIDGDQVIAPNACDGKGRVSIYDYPAGGVPIKVLGGFKNPFAVVVSR